MTFPFLTLATQPLVVFLSRITDRCVFDFIQACTTSLSVLKSFPRFSVQSPLILDRLKNNRWLHSFGMSFMRIFVNLQTSWLCTIGASFDCMRNELISSRVPAWTVNGMSKNSSKSLIYV